MNTDSAEPRTPPVWDLPVRLIHWSIALIVPASWWTAEEGYLEAHQYLGLTALVLVLTRLLWGFVGSPQARFSDFLRGPRAVLAYWRGEPSPTPGHNPAGGWSVMALWLVLLAQILTGTVNSDDVLFTGPFHHLFESGTSDALAGFHELLFNVLVALVALHVLAVAYHEWRKGDQVLRPMVTGRAHNRAGTGPAQPLYKALLIALVLAALLWLAIEMAPGPPASAYYF